MTILTFLLAGEVRPQLLQEEFEYPASDTLARHGWSAHSGVGVNAILITAGSLTFPGYRSSSPGNGAALRAAGGEDVNHGFPAATSGELYCFFLVSVATARSTGDYFFHLLEGPGSGSAFVDKVWARDNGNGSVQFGLTMKASTGPAYSSIACGYDTTHLLVVKHSFVAGPANDQARLWINPDLSKPEGTASLIVSESGSTDPPSLSLIALRQGGASTSAALRIDAITISTLWGEQAAPVTLALFEAHRIAQDRVRLDWITVSERNNYGFFLQKSAQRDAGFLTCPGIVPGAGTSTVRHAYAYTDSVDTGRFYRLGQIDMDGAVRFSDPVEPSVTFAAEGEEAHLPQAFTAFPNPFNPIIYLEFHLPMSGEIDLSVYDILGRKVETLIHGMTAGGNRRIAWNGGNYASGVYLACLRTSRGTRYARLLLVK